MWRFSLRPVAMVVFVAVASFGVAASVRENSEKRSKTQKSRADSYRLSGSVIPTSYEITLAPTSATDLSEVDSFSGLVVINANLGENKNIIDFHVGANLNITEPRVCLSFTPRSDNRKTSSSSETRVSFDCSLICDFGEELYFEDPEWNEATEIYKITLNSTVESDRLIKICLPFMGNMLEHTGLYASEFRKGGQRILTTKLEPTHARNVFPCFDEPQLKATFNLTVHTPDTNYDVISNMRKVGVFDRTQVVFETTPLMSTFALGFTIYNTDEMKLSNTDSSVIQLNTYRKYNSFSSSDFGELSIIEGTRFLEFLGDYTGIESSDFIKKLDQIAMPDVQTATVPSWGFVQYRESDILYNLENGPTWAYKAVSDASSMALAHLWFGYLVTTEWWDSAWLNGGLANYAHYLAMDARYPSWRIMERLVLDEQMAKAFEADALGDAHALTESVESPTDIAQRFGAITYSKGAALLRQIENIMNETSFQMAVQNYLNKRQYQTAKPSDLFEEFEEYSKKSITKNILESWTEMPGCPVINVTRSNASTFSITIERFLQHREWKDKDESRFEKYSLPLTWYTINEDPPSAPKRPQKWLDAVSSGLTVTIDGILSKDWVFFNAFQSGYYRVNYDEWSWAQLSSALEKESMLSRLAPIDRAALIDNSLALARAGYMSYEQAFMLLRFLRHETDFVPWAAARNALRHVDVLFAHNQAYKDFITFIVQRAYTAVGFDAELEDGHLEKTHRTNILSIACAAGHADCLNETYTRLQAHIKNNTISNLLGLIIDHPPHPPTIKRRNVDKDLKSVVFCYGLKNDTGKYWNFVFDMLKDTTNDPTERKILIQALGCTNHRDTLKMYLMESVQQNHVLPHEAYLIFQAVYSNPHGLNLALDFLSMWGYERLKTVYEKVDNVMSIIVSDLAERITTKQRLNQFERALDMALPTEIAINLKTAQRNVEWMEDNTLDLTTMLSKVPVKTNDATGLVPTVALLVTAIVYFFMLQD